MAPGQGVVWVGLAEPDGAVAAIGCRLPAQPFSHKTFTVVLPFTIDVMTEEPLVCHKAVSLVAFTLNGSD
jgi:hypothetical protein